jgi:hypothetical protein
MRVIARARLLAGATAVALLLVGGGMAGSTAATPTATPTVTAAADEPAPIDYVALGDSYSAGPLIPTQRADPFGCLRSTNNYPAYLAGHLGVTTYRDVTCSGARVRDFFNPQTTILPGPSPVPQNDALSAETDLVTVGIGGNDFGLFGSMIEVCEQVRSKNPDGKPCKRHFTNARGVDTKARDARRIEKHVARALEGVHEAAPNAAVHLVGYPRLLPEKGTCDEVPFASGDYRWGGFIERLLNRSLRRAAADHDATYVNLYPATKGHDACAGKRAWINGSELKVDRAANFHPYQVGERGMARAVYHRITGLTAPTNADAEPPPGSVILNLPVAP